MAADPLTPAVSDRICRHMNDDHASAVLSYARHYGGITGARQARMLAVNTARFKLDLAEYQGQFAVLHTASDGVLLALRRPSAP